MQVFEGLNAVPTGFGPSAITIGKFDGVHPGHRAVISELKSVAAERGLIAGVVTFDRNPLSLLAPEKCPVSLVSNAQKLELLEAVGVDVTLVLTFDQALASQSPEEFVESVLVGALQAKVVFVGADFRFGVRGSGNVELLDRLGKRYDFEVRHVPEVAAGSSEQRRASSTWIRELLDAGDVGTAAAQLGRLHSIRSTVVHGEQRGRELGYPTANLSPDIEGFIPRDGVYATWATVPAGRFGAAVSIGNNPTFEGVPQKQVEAHLLDQSFDLYGQPIELEFVEYIRPMNKFESADALAAQMHADEQLVRAILAVPVPG
ncbi:MAG TPA: bifunctional riboflavin kinase/FAD synthetase [Galbitalea sp.]|jgi:riboflavin kinase/FMN adenylyltransferase|nr:bifunctional riboflavin kinase/FAD synthetase [Galbitalea sp.]